MQEKRVFYKVDGKLVMNDPDLGVLERNPSTYMRQAGPQTSYLYDNAVYISAADLIQGYQRALDILDTFNDPQQALIKEVIQSSQQFLYPDLTKRRFLSEINVLPAEDKTNILKALATAEEVHQGQKRDEGGPYVSHCIAVARKAIKDGGDAADIIVCLLHDAYEDYQGDRGVFYQYLKDTFTDNIADSIVKLSKWQGSEKLSNDVYLTNLSQDIINLKRKTYDRIHNIESLRFIDKEKRDKYIDETINKYLPILQNTYPDIAKKIQDILNLYNTNKLDIMTGERKILMNLKSELYTIEKYRDK